ncbi:ribose ABC transporter permease [Treponema sp.]|jgi:ribose/xylose/arabinose/galactoside ABC-type transport system permease subunit
MSSHALRRLILIGLIVVIALLITAMNPVFMTAGNINKMFQEASQIGIVAIGFTLVMITAGIDMSIGGIIAVTAMVAVNFISYTKIPVLLFIPVALLVGALTGLVNGVFITRFKLPAFIVTLATKGILTGLALVIAVKDDLGFVQNVYIDNNIYLWFGSSTFGGVFRTTIAFVILGFAVQFFLKNTKTGTNIYASGANPVAANLTGINVEATSIGVYVFAGICASIAAIFISSRMMTAMPELGLGTEMDVIASVVIGGTAFTGGSGDIIGTMLGSVFLALIKNGILKLGMSPWIQPIVIGGIIVVTVIIDVWQKTIAENIATKAKLRRLQAVSLEETV